MIITRNNLHCTNESTISSSHTMSWVLTNMKRWGTPIISSFSTMTHSCVGMTFSYNTGKYTNSNSIIDSLIKQLAKELEFKKLVFEPLLFSLDFSYPSLYLRFVSRVVYYQWKIFCKRTLTKLSVIFLRSTIPHIGLNSLCPV